VLASAVLAGAAVLGYRAAGQRAARAPEPSAPVSGHAPRFTLPSALVAWFDGDGTLRIGNVATLAQRPVAQVAAQPCCTLIVAGGRIYWAAPFRGMDYIKVVSLATGTVRNVAPGSEVFAAADRRTVYIEQSDRRLLAVPADGRGPARRLVTPRGWQVATLPRAAAGGIMLSKGIRPPAIGLWRPGTGTVRVIGRGYLMAAWTQPSGQRSLIAWLPAKCSKPPCEVAITNTSTGRTLTAHAPLHDVFLGQGGDMAFSPDGSMLAAFVSRTFPSTAGFVPAVINTTTGAARPVRHAMLSNGEMAGWLVWLPGAGYFLAGPAVSSSYPGYAIDARTATARPFGFITGSHYKYPESPVYDITYGAVVVPPSDAPPRGP